MSVITGYFKILAAAFIWGTIGMAARLSGLPPLELSFFRLLIASLTLFAYLPRERRLVIIYSKDFIPVIFAGILFAVDCLLFFYALQLTTISNAVIPYNMQPLFIAVLTPVLLREKLERRSILAVTLSLAGVGMLLVPSVVSVSVNDLLGVTLALAGAFLLSVIALITVRLNISASTFVYYEMLIASICLLPFVNMPGILTWQNITAVATLGILHTAVAYIFYYDGLKAVKIQYAITLSYFAPVVAAMSGYFFFKENISFFTVAGGLLITFNGIYIVLRAQ